MSDLKHLIDYLHDRDPVFLCAIEFASRELSESCIPGMEP
jgi:hypothetical protein